METTSLLLDLNKVFSVERCDDEKRERLDTSLCQSIIRLAYPITGSVIQFSPYVQKHCTT